MQSDPPIWALQLGATTAFSFKQADNGELVDVTATLQTSIEAPLGKGRLKIA
ncbi:hypothetical protein [Bradyrhizobium genosp. SA-3]|uniref:hypothetical protein n=1 Tax=Bradyrhizobium genosp. SA-3 TaxID=508868 RepID=UPI0013EEC24B|nr:hypothetical protein [Bradyrhizobium genosp. SA-3]